MLRPRLLATQWALTRWLAESGWRSYLDAAGSAKLSGSFKRFADIMLGRCGAELKALFAQVRHPQEYQDKLPRLQHQILAIRLLGGAYGEAAVDDYLAPWQTLAHAIAHPAAATPEAACAQALHQPAFGATARINSVISAARGRRSNPGGFGAAAFCRE
ncbi:hypothetical protein O0544_04805 [Edwardsiella anguillarum]|nr:hypothetical protein [Edwardsiella anguillarum]